MNDYDKELKIAVICGDRSGPFYHDFGVPIPFFHKFTNLKFTCFNDLRPSELLNFDIVHYQRQYAAESLMILRNIKRQGMVTIQLVDDNVWELPKSNPAHATYQGAIIERYNMILAEADAATTSTSYLKQLIQKYNPNVHIFRNLVDPAIANLISIGRDNPEEIRIGWTLTPHHAEDAKYALPALKEILLKYKNTKAIFMGWLPPYVMEYYPYGRWEYYAFVPVDAFYACFANLDFDIGIAPLEDNPFNKGKTARKMQEYAILRTPAIISPVAPYEEWEHNKVCLKPKDNKHYFWVQELSKMVEDASLREKLVTGAYEQVMKNHDIYKHIYERAKTYYDIYYKAKGEK